MKNNRVLLFGNQSLFSNTSIYNPKPTNEITEDQRLVGLVGIEGKQQLMMMRWAKLGKGKSLTNFLMS